MDTTMFISFVFLLFLECAHASLGLIKRDERGGRILPSTANQSFCIAYNPGFQKLPTSYGQQPSHPVANFTHLNGCNDSYGADIQGKVVAVARYNCTFVDKAAIIQEKGGVAALVVDFNDQASFAEPGVANNSSDYNRINITIAIMHHRDFTAMMAGESDVHVWMYAPEPPKFDPSVLIMFTMATTCVVIGSLWAGNARVKTKKTRSRTSGGGADSEEDGDDKKDEESTSLAMGILMSFCLVVFFCVTITLLYYFYDYLVYVIIAIFSIAGINALFQAIQPLWKKLIPCDKRLALPFCSKTPQIRSIVLLLLAIGFVVTWFLLRHQSYAWVLQDIIGFCFCLYVMKSLVLPSLKACAVLLSLLFVYDIFFVFITPYFTQSGESIMIKVATGGDSKSGEQMPTVFVLPHLRSWAMSTCIDDKGSMLGFGDVIVPGLLLSYNCAFDLKTHNPANGRPRYLYFAAAAVGYVVGLTLTGIALFVMESGQPALLYLVPCTLLTTIAIAAFRKELGYMWRGHECPKKNDDAQPVRTTPPSIQDARVLPGDVNGTADNDDDDSPSENQSLIQ